MIAGVLTIALNLPLSWTLSKAFGLGGLGLSLALTTWLEMAILLIVLRRRMGVIAPGLTASLVRIFWATAAMTVVLMPCSWLLHATASHDRQEHRATRLLPRHARHRRGRLSRRLLMARRRGSGSASARWSCAASGAEPDDEETPFSVAAGFSLPQMTRSAG